MKVMPEVNNLQKAMMKKMFASFSKSCVNEELPLNDLKTQFYHLSNAFSKKGMGDSFCNSTQTLVSELEKSGDFKLANILISELGKFCSRTGNNEAAEFIFSKALALSEKMGDKIHMVARYTDLEMLYKEAGDKKALYKTLKAKISLLKDIIKNYDSDVSKFSTISKKPTTIENVKTQLAFAYSDLADLLKFSKIDDAIKLVCKSKDLYADLGRQKEVNYLEVKVRNLKNLKEKLELKKVNS